MKSIFNIFKRKNKINKNNWIVEWSIRNGFYPNQINKYRNGFATKDEAEKFAGDISKGNILLGDMHDITIINIKKMEDNKNENVNN